MILNHKLCIRVVSWVLVALGVIAGGDGQAATSRWQLDIANRTQYESNIYHSFADSLETTAMVNVVDIEVDWKWRPSKRIRHRFRPYVSLALYPSFSERDQSAFGIAYEPYWRYSGKGKISIDLDLSRRNKDLVDDAGQVLARTLEKWRADVALRHDYRFGRFTTELLIRYGLDDYDEVTGTISYDYRSYGGRARLMYDLTSKLKSRVTFDLEQRSYDERRTYTVKYGAFIGRPYEIRKYTLSDFELSASYEFSRHNDIRLDANFSRRTENFENFYGYDAWQYRVTVDLQPAAKHRFQVSFRFKDKAYENYWNSRIGGNHRVWVEYADFQVEYEYQLSDILALSGYLRDYNKVSNDRSIDYHDLTAGIGFQIEL